MRNGIESYIEPSQPVELRPADANLPHWQMRQVPNFGKFGDITCDKCGALKWPAEVQSFPTSDGRGRHRFCKIFCCNGGKVSLQPMATPPPELLELYTGQTPQAKYFRKHIRQFNVYNAMSSREGREIRHSGYNPCYQLGGAVYHRIGTFLPQPGQTAKFAQIWTLDSEDQMLETRCGLASNHENPTLFRNVQRIIQGVLLRHPQYSKYVRQFVRAGELMAQENGRQARNVQIVLQLAKTANRNAPSAPGDAGTRTYNNPTSSQVCVVMHGSESETGPSERHDVVVRARGGWALQRVSYINAAYDPLYFVLFGSYGGWHHEEKSLSSTGGNVTIADHYAYRLHVRDGFSALHNSGRLFQEYVATQSAKKQLANLNYLRGDNMQKILRRARREVLTDALRGDGNLDEIGRRTILPSSVKGSPRAMNALYHDAMAIVRVFKRPTIFFTMTMNPNHPDVLEALRHLPSC